MQLKIAGKEYELKFGLKFIRQLDEKYKVDYQGLEFGMGVNLAFMGLTQYNPATLAEVIKAAVSHEGAVRLKDVDTAIEEYAEENDGLRGLFEEINEEMGKSKVVKDTLEQFKKNAVVQD